MINLKRCINKAEKKDIALTSRFMSLLPTFYKEQSYSGKLKA